MQCRACFITISLLARALFSSSSPKRAQRASAGIQITFYMNGLSKSLTPTSTIGVIFALIENHQAAAKALEDTLKLSTCPRRFPAQSPSPHGVTVNQESETSKKSFLFFSIFARESGRRVCIVDREHGTKVKAQTLQPCAGCETRGRVLLLTIPTHVRAQAPHFAVSIRDHFLSDVSV